MSNQTTELAPVVLVPQRAKGEPGERVMSAVDRLMEEIQAGDFEDLEAAARECEQRRCFHLPRHWQDEFLRVMFNQLRGLL